MSQQLSLTSSVRIREGVLSRDLQGEAVILNLNTGLYFGLDPVGTRIWQLIEAHQSLQKVLDAMIEEYEVGQAQCAEDLLSFVTKTLEKRLVEVCNGAGP